ncbi:MAG: DUF4872 domain-containing protein, partial [Sphingobacteriales bacterium]
QLGIELSEPMLFGLGEGLSFIFWHMKTMNFPFLGGRIKPDLLTENIARNLELELKVKETASVKKAWAEVKVLLDAGEVVGLKLDCYHLEYFSRPFHFAGHYAAIYGYEKEQAYLVDTRQQGGKVKTSLESLARARAAKGPMSSRNLYYTLNLTKDTFDLAAVIPAAIRNNATAYLNPPIQNIAYKGILKTANDIQDWFKSSSDVAQEFATAANIMEHAGTGGALFRNLYRDFLKESYDLLQLDILKAAYADFVEIAVLWTKVSDLFINLSATRDKLYLDEASAILKDLSIKEQQAMERLSVL